MSVTPLRVVRSRPQPAPQQGRPEIGALLVGKGALLPPDLFRAQALLARQEADLPDTLLARGLVSEPTLLAAFADQSNARIVDPLAERPDARLIDTFGAVRCLREGLLPWRRAGGVTIVLSSRPDRFYRRRDELVTLYGPVALALAAAPAIEEAVLRSAQKELRDQAESTVGEEESCRNWRPQRLARIGIGVAMVMILLLATSPRLVVGILAAVALLVLAASTVLRLAALAARLPSLLAERRPAATADVEVPLMRLPVVSLLVPMFREEDIAPRLLARLGRIDYPRELLDVILVLEERDGQTHKALAEADLPPWMRIVTVPDGPLRTKPRAMNFALDFARGSIVGVYDAEDAPHPDQINQIVRRFYEAPPEVACLQGVLDYYNARTNWLARCFTVEYASWFRVILPGLQRLGLPLPLGGTTLFMRRDALEALGRWDAHNVTEDADLGIRLTRHGYRTEVLPTVTEEEANCRALPWVRQRSRWIKGHAITWAVHMRDPGKLRRDLGWRGFWGMQLIFAGAVAQPLLAPVLWSFWALALGLGHPLSGMLSPAGTTALLTLFFGAEVLNMVCGMLAVAVPGRRFLLPFVPTLHFYHPLATLAAAKAIYELASRPFYWDKTAHGIFDASAPASPASPPVNA